MRIGRLANQTGVSERMLRYYEQEGLLQPTRTASGYRDYSNDDMETVRHIHTLSNAGLKIEVIRTLLPCIRGNQPVFEPCTAVRAALKQELGKLDQKLSDLGKSRQMVAGYLESLDS